MGGGAYGLHHTQSLYAPWLEREIPEAYLCAFPEIRDGLGVAGTSSGGVSSVAASSSSNLSGGGFGWGGLTESAIHPGLLFGGSGGGGEGKEVKRGGNVEDAGRGGMGEFTQPYLSHNVRASFFIALPHN